jgi:hypothetical protein
VVAWGTTSVPWVHAGIVAGALLAWLHIGVARRHPGWWSIPALTGCGCLPVLTVIAGGIVNDAGAAGLALTAIVVLLTPLVGLPLLQLRRHRGVAPGGVGPENPADQEGR